LTFFHPTTAHLPVSAVCLLSRQGWKEFEGAINRIVAQSIAGLSNSQADQSAKACRESGLTTVQGWRRFVRATPFLHRMTGSHPRR
jgi:hypothetical protein